MAWGNGRKPYDGGNRSSNSGGGSRGGNFQKKSGGNFKGRGNGGGREKKPNREFKNITGLFLSQSGASHTVFVNEEIHELLQSIQIGNMLCVTPRKDSDMLNFSVMLGEDS